MPENYARNPVQRLARRLLAEAGSHPALIHRSEELSKAPNGRWIRSFPAMALLSDPALDIRQYLENLVTIAVGSSQQAEDMLFEARKAHRKTRRGIALVASFGAIGLIVGAAGFTANRNANVRLSEVRDELIALRSRGQDITSLQQQRKAEEAALARQEAAREALQQQIADLQRQAGFSQEQVARGSRDLRAANTGAGELRHSLQPPPSAGAISADGRQGGGEALEHKVADLPRQTASLQNQDPLHPHDLRAASSEIVKPRKKIEGAHSGTEGSPQDIDALEREGKPERAASSRQKPHDQQTAVLPLPLIPASTAAQRIPVIMPEPSVSQQLLIARQWLATGHLDQARRALAMVQTRMVLQPFESDRAAARGANAMATEVGNAIRWLDMGSNGQAMQALNKALFNASSN